MTNSLDEKASFLANRLKEEGEKVITFFTRLTPEQQQLVVYTGKDQPAGSLTWTIHHILAHFVSSDASIIELIKIIAAGGEGSPENFEIDRFNQKMVQKHENTPYVKLLTRFTELRQKMIELVSCLSSEDLNRLGRHPFLGLASITDIIKLVYRHQQIHIRDIRRLI